MAVLVRGPGPVGELLRRSELAIRGTSELMHVCISILGLSLWAVHACLEGGRQYRQCTHTCA